MSIKSINLLPEIFRSEPNRKFLAATLDQLTSESNSLRLNSYVGRLNAPTRQTGDTYVSESSTARQNYQLETSIIVDAGQGQTDFYSSYLDLLQQIAYYGGDISDHHRLFTNQSYNFNGLFDFDKFVNFSQYLWLPNGPPEVTVSASAIDISLEYNVSRDTTSQSYRFTEFATDRNPIVTLVRGNTYRFLLNQPGHKFWIQTRPGQTGANSDASEALSRQILGVDNNGTDDGTLIFKVPASSAQDDIVKAELVATVDFATTLNYNQIQSNLVNRIAAAGGIDGIKNSFENKTIIFVHQDNNNDNWTDPGNFDFDGFDESAFEYGEKVEGTKRFGVFRIRTVDVGGGRRVVKLDPILDVTQGQKVYVRSGAEYANVQFIKNASGYYAPVAQATAPLDELYYQDDTESGFFGTIKLVDPGVETIDVDADIVGQINYTAPNGVRFTNGLHVRFDQTAVPSSYANNAYIVEGVGTGIKLVNIGNFVAAESYAQETSLVTPDYITISRASTDLNAWSRSNRWFHIQTVELAAQYREDPSLLDLSGVKKGQRPIIEFEPNIYLFDYGRNGKPPVDILDFVVVNAFKEVEGKSEYVVRMPNGNTRMLTPGTRIIFANDEDPDVRNKIYRVELITASSGSRLHLVSTSTTYLPSYEVSGAVITSNLAYNFVPTVTFAAPLPGIGTDTANGVVVLKSTGVETIDVNYSGIGYIDGADPYILINSEVTTDANITINYKPFKTVDYIRIDSRGTGYTSTSPTVTIENPNAYYLTITNISLGGSTIKAGNPIELTTDASGNVSVEWGNVGLGYTAPIATITTGDGAETATTVNQVYLHANGAIKAVNIDTTGYVYYSPPTITFTGANTYTATGTVLGVDSSAGVWNGISAGMQIVGNGFIGGTIVTAVDELANLITFSAPVVTTDLTVSPPVTGLSTININDVVTFKSNTTAGTFATVANTVIDATTINVDSTAMLDTGMVLSGGTAPVEIDNIRIDVVPTRILTTVDHNLSDGDLILIRSVVGTTELNFGRYYVKKISDTAIDLYVNSALTAEGAQDSRNFADYSSGGTVTAYTADYGIVTVSKVISDTQFTTSRAVSLKQGTKLVFVGVPAKALARSDGNGIYNITVTNPGAGYNTVPNVTIQTSSGNQAAATAITNNKIINYIAIDDPGTGYKIGANVSISVVSQVEVTTANVVTYGTDVLYFNNPDDIVAVQPGWLAWLVTTVNDEEIYTDFAQVPYAETDVTGPDPVNYKFYMDVSMTRADIRRVITVDSDRIILDDIIHSLDSDGEIIDLPAGSKIRFSAQPSFFTSDGYGSSPRDVLNSKSGFVTVAEAVESSSIFLDSVAGIQPGMLVQDLSNTLPDDVRVVAVDPYVRKLDLSRAVTISNNLPLNIKTEAELSLVLASAEIESIDIVDPGQGYTSAPDITIQPLYDTITILASCDGGAILNVTDYAGIQIGSRVTSEYDIDGNGITTGDQIPVVTELFEQQTGSATFEKKIRLSVAQPAFSDVFVTFTYAAQALATVALQNQAFVSDDATPETYDVGDTILVNIPASSDQLSTRIATYNQFYYNGTEWLPAQAKTLTNQEPLFDVYDATGASAGDSTVYPGTTFNGTKIFGYTEGTGAVDTILGFPLSYKSFENVGDIQFTNYFQTDTFDYLEQFAQVSKSIGSFVLRQQTDAGLQIRNLWTPADEKSKQFQVINHLHTGETNYFEIDISPSDSKTIPYFKVYIDNKRLDSSLYTTTVYGGRSAVVIQADQLTVGQLITIKIFSKSISKIGYFETPGNLDHNPINTNFTSLTLGQVRNHLVKMADEHYGLTGQVLGKNNLRDIVNKDWQGTIQQHTSPVALASLFMVEQNLDIIKAVEFAQREYSKFKSRFLDMATKIQINVNDIPASVDAVMGAIMTGKSSLSPWYDSDMMAYGSKFKTTTTLPILDVRIRSYLIPQTFDPTVLSTRSVLIYQQDPTIRLNRQLISGIDFTFNTATSTITIADHVELAYTQRLLIVDYSDTTENYIPETPTKLGLYPKYTPRIFVDNTYRTPTLVIQGHDGSITPAYNDFRDQLWLEVELRIYNNIKVRYEDTLLEIYDTQPGKFRTTDYTRTEFNNLLTRTFLNWIGNNKLDYSTNKYFSSSDSWSWTYSRFKDSTGELLPGAWRGIYNYYYDTDRPHTNPWEMLGFTEEPSWWQTVYGPAPYTGGNKLLWQHLEDGYIAGGIRTGYDSRFARPGLSNIIPVDDTGNLIEPIKLVVANYNATETSLGFVLGDQGPVETAWRRSSDYPFALQIALILARPAFYLGTLFDNSRYFYNAQLGQVLQSTDNNRITPDSIKVPDSGLTGNDVVLAAGYGNWVRDHLVYRGIDGSAFMRDYLLRLDVRLSYKLGGFTNKNMLEIVAEQSSPTGTGQNIIVPDENYRVYLHKGAPLQRLIYSAVIVEATTTGWKVSGYDATRPYFTIIPSDATNNAYAVTSGDVSVNVFKDYQNRTITVPYGFEFNSYQQLADFLVSYGRYLLSLGFIFNTFNDALGVTQDWDLSIKEFLSWAQQGWKPGSVIVLSPIGSELKFFSKTGTVDQISNKLAGSKLLDQNFTLFKQGEYFITREDGLFTTTSMYDKMIAFADLNLVQYEHVIILDNTTVFNDVIYSPDIGNRQARLKLMGYKTGNWTGQLSAPGFVYNSEKVDDWIARASYSKGSLVSYKNQYYLALEKVPESGTFDFTYWTPIDKDQIKTGLLPNLSNVANRFRQFYDVDQMNRNEDIDRFSNGLIGFRDRNYLSDLGIDRTSQVKFYQGYIKQKGSKNAIDSLTTASFNRVFSEINFHEEWAFRVGEYGATGSDQYVEVQLDEASFTEDPATVVLLEKDASDVAGFINFSPYEIYRGSEEVYNNNIVKARTDLTPRLSDNITAGYPRLDDIDGTIYDISNYQSYYTLIDEVGSGYKIWVAVDFNKSWNVYRATETDVLLLSISKTATTDLLFTFDKPHGSFANDFIAIKNFSDKLFDGFYRVTSVVNNLSFKVQGYRNLTELQQVTSLEGTGVFFKMISVRFGKVSEIIDFTPPHGWRNQDRVWIDNDTNQNVWGVFEKTDGWKFNQLLPLRQGEERFREGYGWEVKISSDNVIILAGTPKFTAGSLSGLKVVYPGSNYTSPVVVVDPPTGEFGQTAQFNVIKDNGRLIDPALVTSGYGYTIAPNISITDSFTTTVTSDTVNSIVINVPAGDEERIFIGDSVSGQGIPPGYVVANIPNVFLHTVQVTPTGSSEVYSASTSPVAIELGTKIFNMVLSASQTDIITGQGIRVYPYGLLTSYMEGYVVDFTDNELTVEVEIIEGTGTYTQWTVISSLTIRSGTEVTFSRGEAGRLAAKLSPTEIDYIEVVNGGSNFLLQPQIEIVGGGGSGAKAVAVISGGTIESVNLINPGSGYTEAPDIILLTNNASTVELRARLKLTTVDQLIVTDAGTNYREPTISFTAHTSDRGTGAAASLSFYGNGGISAVTVTSSGFSYGNTANITIANSTTGSGFVGNVTTWANGRVRYANVINSGSGYDTVFSQANIYYFGGTGTTGTVDRTTDGIAEFGGGQVITLGQGYLTPPAVQVVDLSGSGSGAIVEAIIPTGQVKTFLRANQNSTTLEETQLIKPFSSDAREFGYSIDIGTILAAIGAPGSFGERGGVYISQTLGSQWISYQMLYPSGLTENARFGHSVAMSRNQQWIYVGAPGINKVYCYGQKTQTFGRVELVPSTGQLSYPTNFLALKSANELKVLGANGKLYEAGFDYDVDSQGIVYFADYDRIGSQSKIYITRQRLQTTIIPTVIRNLVTRSYALASRPETIDQLLVYGATGRVFVPNREFTIVGSNLIFLDDTFLSEASIVAVQRDVFYQLVEVIEPTESVNENANYGWSISCDNLGYRLIVGAPNYDETDAASAGRAYVYSRSYEVQLSIGNTNIFTLPSLRPVTAVFIDDILQTELVDFVVEGNSIILTKTPRNGARIKVDTNFFNIIQRIDCPSAINQGLFGYSVDIAPDNKSLVVGSPGYRDADYYNGQVYRFVNKGLFYGTLTTEKTYLETAVFQGNTIKINDATVTFSNVVAGKTQTFTAAYSSFTDVISFTSNIAIDGFGVGDLVRGPDIPLTAGIQILEFGSDGAGYANVRVSASVTSTAGDSISVVKNGDNVSVIKRNIDSAGAVAVVTALNSDGTLTIGIDSETNLATLDILPGVGTALDGIGIKVYSLLQTIQHPRYGVPEKFGTKVSIDNTGLTVGIASRGGNTLKTTTFDTELTLFDRDTTRYIDNLNASGAVYIYDYLSPPGETLLNPGRLLYNQVLQNAYILTGDDFGTSIDINNGWALVGAEFSDYHGTEAGAVHLFVNDGDVKGWSRLRSRGEELDIDYINKVMVYSKSEQVNLQDLDYFDPIKGKILGIADQDLDYKSSYDPAQYNRGTNSSVTITTDTYWGPAQEGQTWWDLSLSRYINYEQGDLNYRSKHWGELFPGAVVRVYEWVASSVLPSLYQEDIGDGIPKHPDDSAYVEQTYLDQQSGLIKTRYFYWVYNKRLFDRNTIARTNSVVTLEQMISDPQGQGIPYVAAVASNAFNLYNIANYLDSNDTILRVEYSRILGDIISHNEYELVQEGNENSSIPLKLINKMIDSISGENSTGSVVPDLRLSTADAYGISNLPRQSMIIDNLAAAKVFVTFVNNALATRQIAEYRDLSRLQLAEDIPQEGVGFYNISVDTVDQLQYIAESQLFIGLKVLVRQDSDFFGYWTIYEYQQYVGFRMVRIQSYDTTRWWSYKTWYATGFDQYTQYDYVVTQYNDIFKLDLVAGDVVKVLTTQGSAVYKVYQYQTDGTIKEVIAENGTIALSNALFDPLLSRIGFDNSAFDQVGFSTTQAVELRNIFEALVNEIFINEDKVLINTLFFTLLNYILSEQLVVDWALKTSLISVLHKIRKLEQFPNYIKDNQDYYEDYINEVKPYRTQVREYLLDYQGNDEVSAAMSDFDFSAIYDKGFSKYRVLDPNNARDLILINSGSRKDWLENYSYQIQNVTLISGGTGYTSTPRVQISGGGGTGAVARAVLGAFVDGVASVASIVLIKPGSGYTSTPLVEFFGGGGTGAKAAVDLVQSSNTPVTQTTLNKKIRAITTKLKFDRISYFTGLRKWQPYEIYQPGDIIVVDDVVLKAFYNYTERNLPRYSVAYRVLKTLLGRNTIDLNVFEDTTVVEKLLGSDLDNTNDRIAAYLRPGSQNNARIYQSPDTIRLDSPEINDQIISVGKQWNVIRHSVTYPTQHGYQYLAAGDGSLIGTSVDGYNWTLNRITDTTINFRDAFIYQGYMWVAVSNQGTLFMSEDGINWTREAVDQYSFDPTTDDTNGKIKENTAQTLDITGGAGVTTTYSDMMLIAGNNGVILINPRGNSAINQTLNGWYQIKIQNLITNQNYLRVVSVDRGNLADIDGTTYDVEIQPVSGYFTVSTSTLARTMKAGYLFTLGVNGAINAITYNALDDLLNGFIAGYNYSTGKNNDLTYPWKTFSVPSAVKGTGDGYSGEQLNAMAVSGQETNWVVAVGSSGTLLWNQINLPLEIETGRAELAADTIGKTVVDHNIYAFNNFRYFDNDNFVAPLTKSQLDDINFYDITWDGEKFIVVGQRSIVLWGIPGTLPDAYIEIGSTDPSMYVTSRRESASWTGGASARTSIEIVIAVADIDVQAIVEGMSCQATGIPTDAIVSSVAVGTSTHIITVEFASAIVASATNRQVTFVYALIDDILTGDTIVASDGTTSIELNVSKDADKGTTRIYVDNYDDRVQSNWTLTHSSLPANARVKWVGKFANFQWQLAPGTLENINFDYRSVTVNTTTVTISQPLMTANTTVDGLFAGNIVTFFDPTGTIIQLPATQTLLGNSTVLTFESTRQLGVGFTVQPNVSMGVRDSTVITSVVNYNIGGVVSGLATDIPNLVPGTKYPGAQVLGQDFTDTATDSLSLDTNITSEFTDNLLGTRPEDIIVDGGKFIDTYASHAPEELVPGQVIDSLQMNVFTKDPEGSGEVVQFKIFTDYKLPSTYYRISAANTTVLTANLSYNDTEVSVDDIGTLPDSGSVWINAEKIVYQAVDRTNGKLLDIRRGSLRTSIPLTHVSGSLISDASADQLVAQDVTTKITENVTVENGIVGGSNSSTYLSSAVTSIQQGTIWLDLE